MHLHNCMAQILLVIAGILWFLALIYLAFSFGMLIMAFAWMQFLIAAGIMTLATVLVFAVATQV